MRPSQETLREWLHYDPCTGIFVWKKKPSKRILAGAVAGTPDHDGYIKIQIQGVAVRAHQIAWRYVYGIYPDGLEIDHIDGDPSNNSIANLRLATRSQQRQNCRVRSNSSSGLKGVTFRPRGTTKKWQSLIKVGPKRISLGFFHTAEEAHEAYRQACVTYFGEFGRAA